MDIITIVGLGIVAMVLVVMLKQYKPEYAVIASVGASIIILALLLTGVVPLINELEKIFSSSNMPYEYMEIMLKAMGICFIAQIACDTCKDAGESSIAAKVEMAGKVAVLLVALPLFSGLIEIATELIQS